MLNEPASNGNLKAGNVVARPRRSLIVNIVSISRIPLAAMFLFVTTDRDGEIQKIGLPILIFIISSDIIDGILARHWNVATARGHVIDGIADRSFYFAFAFVVCAKFNLPWLWCYLLILRESLLLASRSAFPNWSKTIVMNNKLAKSTGFLTRLVLSIFLGHYFSTLYNCKFISARTLNSILIFAKISALALIPYSYVTLFVIVKSYINSSKPLSED